MTPILTIDGPVSSGKGTVARRVAIRLGWHLLDSGALYRVLGYHARNQGVALDDEPALIALAQDLPVRFVEQQGNTAVILAGEDVSNIIRQESVGELASQVAVLQPVRDALLARQRVFAESPGLVADGRDMGTVVFTSAPLKIYLTASAEERARRRFEQLKEKGFGATLATLVEDIRTRDDRDMNREVAPLRPADDAVVIDSTTLTVDEVVNRILDEAAARQLV
ncbi:MAG: cytidylate kinase [Alcanivorax borkumensis]|jgi:cytidylate kinase|uniref:Cytidylate kinase n=1 Tax=Alcanivorax borkumensis (strain ATCC 700651 / DSM 11573 / NCIMB 13689 / SK2) TaxID=393595 RepID=Q0VNQ4_ALCBS|nr:MULTISPECIES: (d)CMP kinase [Alcanivorax]OJH08458.1 MAG: cytidylate kinase [Alcanivorax borkumensis]EUC69480.1 cytidylate kinase [Alcanivorax sp. 97CO-5]PKG01392.1 (d)CMP kinase [Alcanivorax sp. 97CO-6]CAL17194.1 cytidylate kinase [Alcanivorax borkumensis SK2]BAP14652.1 cytidylate kinase [Alcanivorax sp. NBRC 101098]